MASANDLWGGQLVAVAFDPVSHTCDLRVRSTVSSRTTEYLVTCRDVRDLRFHNAIPEPWEYAELTEAHIGTDDSGGQTLELVLWSEDAELVVACAAVEISEGSP